MSEHLVALGRAQWFPFTAKELGDLRAVRRKQVLRRHDGIPCHTKHQIVLGEKLGARAHYRGTQPVEQRSTLPFCARGDAGVVVQAQALRHQPIQGRRHRPRQRH
jgi:hypothetical protein